MNRKLGKKSARHDARTLMLSAYVDGALPPPPTTVDWSKAVPRWPMFKNDSIGDCTCAAAGHIVQGWTGNARQLVTVTDAAVLEMYSAITGFDPANPDATDNGAVCLDVLKFWRKIGIRWPGGALDALGAFAYCNPKNTTLVKDAVYLMGGLYCGVQLPISAQNQRVWDVVPHSSDNIPGSWGGHCINIIGYDPRYLTCVTWGALLKMTWAFWQTYCDEAYALFDSDWIGTAGKAPNGIDIAALKADLAKL